MDYEDFLIVHLVPLITSPLDGVTVGDNDRVSAVFWNGERIQTMGRAIGRGDHLSKLDDHQGRTTKLILDIAGVNDSRADFGRLKKALRRGGPYWLEAGAEDEEDLFDVLTLDPSIAAVGSLRAEGVELFGQAIEVSDACIPLLYVQDGEVLFKNHVGDLLQTCGELAELGFEECIIMDLDSLGGSIDRSLWNRLSSLDIGCIPAGGIDPEDIPFLSRCGYGSAIMDPRIFAEPSSEDDLRPLETEHTISRPRHYGFYSGT